MLARDFNKYAEALRQLYSVTAREMRKNTANDCFIFAVYFQ